MARLNFNLEEMTNEQIRDLLQLHCDRIMKGPADNINSMLPLQILSYDKETSTTIIKIENNDPKLANPGGKVLHGGLSGLIMDNAMGYVSSIISGGMTTTVNMSINYIRPLFIGKDIFLEVVMDKRGKTMNFMSAKAFYEGAEDKPLLTGTATYYLIDM